VQSVRRKPFSTWELMAAVEQAARANESLRAV